ncbi:unnamed protein product [Triticum turgidum subsp. durum]|uniref:Uncharacterized protein n=3 Tax=Triticum TaxID=4564 RepID=A0A9R0WHP6_TRITD|nr:unnamed protein product [Triticum turgidum subsp. durum]
MMSKLQKGAWMEGTFVETIKEWQREWFYITAPLARRPGRGPSVLGRFSEGAHLMDEKGPGLGQPRGGSSVEEEDRVHEGQEEDPLLPLSALFSCPATVVAFKDKDDGCALGVGGFHHLVITFQVALHPDMGLARGRRHLCARDRRSRIRLVNILCYTPDAGAGCIDLNPLPQEVEGRRDWETAEMPGRFSADQSAKEVAVLYVVPGDRAGQFHAEKMGYHDEMVLLCSQGTAEVLVLAARP